MKPLTTLPGLPVGRLIRPNTCANCKWSQKAGNNVECRESPPTATTFMIQQRPGEHGFLVHTTFPIVQPDAFCGKWAAKVHLANGEGN